MPPISGVRKACLGCRSLCFQGHLYSTTLYGQPSEHWHFWILSRLAPRKGFDLEMRKPFETSSSLWWVWLATRWYALRALSSWNNPHSLAFCGSLSCCLEWMWGYNAIASTNFVTFSALFFSSASWRVKTLLHFEAVMKPALCRYHSSHCHCFEVVLWTCSVSVTLKDNNLKTSLLKRWDYFSRPLVI